MKSCLKTEIWKAFHNWFFWSAVLIGTVFALLALLGIVVDPTTEGIGDSERALGYDEPYPKHAAE